MCVFVCVIVLLCVCEVQYDRGFCILSSSACLSGFSMTFLPDDEAE